MGFSFGFGAFQVIFFLMFGIFIVFFLITAVKGIRAWNKNNHSPRLTVEATVVSKRQNTNVHHHNTGVNGAMHTSTPQPIMLPFRWPAVTEWNCM